MPEPSTLLHGTAIAVDGRGVLIVGPSGSGKSDLALRCLLTCFHYAGRPVATDLVSDDQTVVTRVGPGLVAAAPATIAGKLEVRGQGIVTMPFIASAELRLVCDVTPGAAIERLPDPPETTDVLGVALPLLRLRATEAGAAARLVLAALRLP